MGEKSERFMEGGVIRDNFAYWDKEAILSCECDNLEITKWCFLHLYLFDVKERRIERSLKFWSPLTPTEVKVCKMDKDDTQSEKHYKFSYTVRYMEM